MQPKAPEQLRTDFFNLRCVSVIIGRVGNETQKSTFLTKSTFKWSEKGHLSIYNGIPSSKSGSSYLDMASFVAGSDLFTIGISKAVSQFLICHILYKCTGTNVNISVVCRNVILQHFILVTWLLLQLLNLHICLTWPSWWTDMKNHADTN